MPGRAAYDLGADLADATATATAGSDWDGGMLGAWTLHS